MKTIDQQRQASFRTRGSKFIGHLFRADDVDEFEAKLEDIKQQYSDATHHCFARRINPHQPEEFYRGDGEPHGTAGLPILNQLKSFNVVNCGCVVVRYYGGTKLGKPGLIDAYGKAAKDCLAKASFLKIIPAQTFRVTYSYDNQSQINHLKNSFDLKERSAEYCEDVCLEVSCGVEKSKAFAEALRQLEHLGITFEELGDRYITQR